MGRAFTDIAFTNSVKAAQIRYGTREYNALLETTGDARNHLTATEAHFIEARDSFYQASVTENNWPYVQHRGGPAGFVRVLDSTTIAYGDFSGNRQYLSVGNFLANDRVHLFFMDYARQRRLKIWGRVNIIDGKENRDIMLALATPAYRAQIERAVIIRIEAFEWNCSQHITPRFTEIEIHQGYPSAMNDINDTALLTNNPVSRIIGNGQLALVISGVRQLTSRIRAYELRAPDGRQLPLVTAGSHLQLPVILANGKEELRHYSICSNPAQRDFYEIAVLRDDTGRGGSQAVHTVFGLGLQLNCGLPQNHFHLHADASPAIFIAGGIGITPIKPMAQTLALRGRRCQIHYAGRSLGEMAFQRELEQEFPLSFFSYPKDGGKRIDVMHILADASPTTLFYVCGPRRLLDAVYAAASALGISKDRIQSEQFTAIKEDTDKPVILELARKNKLIQVAADQSLLTALQEAGINVEFDCCVGECGACSTKVLEGEIEHRDSVLSNGDKAKGMMCLCVSRAVGEKLVLDL